MIVFGSINLDLSFALPRLPAPGETQLGRDLLTGPGGKGANQALAARLDGAAVVMAGAVGADAFAGPALVNLRAAGVDLSRVAAVEASTGVAAICVDPDGRNQIAVASGANAWALADQVEDRLLTAGAVLLLQMECDRDETARLIRRARARGVTIVLNLAPAAQLAEDALRSVDWLIVNEPEAAWLGDADASALHERFGVGTILTLGERGAEFRSTDARGHVSAFPVTAVDSTAAGDCFTGVFAASLERGLATADALRRAAAAAALACTRQGAQISLPHRTEIDRFLD